jgi:hypothetical protein
MKYYILAIPFLFLFTFCSFGGSGKNYFFTKIFDYADIAIDQHVTTIYLVDGQTGFLLATDDNKIMLAGGKSSTQSAIFLRSADGGKSFEERLFGNGTLEDISCSADGKTYYLLCGQFGNEDDRLPSDYQILRSQDIGTTWSEVYLFRDSNLSNVWFLNDSIGFTADIIKPTNEDLTVREVLYKTTDGGKTWSKVDVDMDDLTVCTITPDRKLLGRYMEDGKMAYWQMDIDELIPLKIEVKAPESGLDIYGDIVTDPLTGLHYISLANLDKKVDYIYCLETQESIKTPSPNYGFNVYGDFIGIYSSSSLNQYNSKYRYSCDKGKTWHTETLPGMFHSTSHCLYGEGYLWTTCSEGGDLRNPLMVRVPPLVK